MFVKFFILFSAHNFHILSWKVVESKEMKEI